MKLAASILIATTFIIVALSACEAIQRHRDSNTINWSCSDQNLFDTLQVKRP